MSYISKKLKEQGKTVGLITGNFDVIHVGHIELINYAKEHTDVLIIGVDSNEVADKYREKEAKLINTQEARSKVVGSLRNVDYVFKIETAANKNIEEIQEHILIAIKPHIIFTNPLGDLYYKKRKKRCTKLGIKLLEKPSVALLK